MGCAFMTHAELDYADMQGLVRFGYKQMTKASYALVRVKNAAAARTWLRSAPVTNAVAMDPPPTTALHVAFTAPGLRALGVSEAVIAGFSHEFRAGMAPESRARELGDVESNAPKYWEWGGPVSEPHLVVMFFAEPDHLLRNAHRLRHIPGIIVQMSLSKWMTRQQRLPRRQGSLPRLL